MGVEVGAQSARSRALAVLRIRSRALAVALLPAAVAVVLVAGGSTGHITGGGWDTTRWVVAGLAAVVLLAAAGIALVVARARPAVSPTVAIAEESAPDLYRMVRDLADRLDVPAPSAIALTPDCDSWLEDRAHLSHGRPASEDKGEKGGAEGARSPRGVRGLSTRSRQGPSAPVLVIGSPFLWWMRVGELRAVLAPVVAGTGPSAHPDIAAARRFVRGLDAAVAVTSAPTRGPLSRVVLGGVGWITRLLLRSCRGHAAEMERGVAAAAAERAQAVDYGLRIVAQEQVGLAYAGWDRLLTRVALPAWRMGRWPSRLDAGVVAALTELSRRDRLAEGFTSRLGERPACDLLEEPGTVDEAASLLAARLFHGGPAEAGPDWAPVDWLDYPDEVVDRKWRADAARLHRVLDALGVRHAPNPATPDSGGPTLARVMNHLTVSPDDDKDADVDAGVDVEDGATETSGPARNPGSGVDPRPHQESPSDKALPSDEESPSGQAPLSGRDLPSDGASPSEREPHADSHGDPHPASDGNQHPASDRNLHPASDGNPHPTPYAESTTDPSPNPDPSPDPSPSPDASLPPDPDPVANPNPNPNQLPQPTPDHLPHPTPSPATNPPPTAPDPTPLSTTPITPATPTDEELLLPLGEEDEDDPEFALGNERTAALAAGLSAEVAREEAAAPDLTSGPAAGGAEQQGPDLAFWDDGPLPLFPLQPPRTGRELLADHVTAMVCCAAMDTAGAAPGLDWLDGPSLLVDGERAADLSPRVLTLVETGDPAPLRDWLRRLGVRPEKPVRLI
ncbi:hypothetical protein [Streptomyces sp. NPDC127072]|uniref:hypothetical protein n=1 Tax=Streptomyces sp. NPDC127072 TaxID=3347129 RepID=UPI00364C4FD6